MEHEEEGWRHLYKMSAEELEQLLWKVNFTNPYYASCYYDAYELDVNPHEALYHLRDFIEWVDEEIEEGFIEAKGVWDWMRGLTAKEVAEEFECYLGCMEDECHKAIIDSLDYSPVKDTLYAFGEDALLRSILKCWKENEKKK